MNEPEPVGDALLTDCVGTPIFRVSLAELSGAAPTLPPHETALVERVEQAWGTPPERFTLAQLRLLVGQRFGLKWLSRPTLEIVSRYPATYVDSYPGDLARAALGAATALAFFERKLVREWLAMDWSWRRELYGWSRPLVCEVDAALADVRAALDIDQAD